MHDVVIVGGGPGGSATAHFLSRRGLDVLLLDRSDFPRDKTCGDGLTPRALRVLDQIGILPEVASHACVVDGYEVVAPNGRRTSARITSEHRALVIPRFILDNIILNRAIRSGAQFLNRINVSRVEPGPNGARIHTQNGQSFDARVAVIATGAAYGVLSHSGIIRRPPKVMLAARAYFEDLQRDVARTFQLRFDDVPMPGYGWVFPTGTRSANIGVGFLPRKRSGTAAQAMQRFMRGGALQPLLEGAQQIGPIKGYPIRVDFLTSPTSAQRTLLVGEAAGLVNPLTGEGIDYALESGMLAADHIAQGLEHGLPPDWLPAYDRLLHDRFERIFRFSEHIRDWYCKPPLLNLLVPVANSRPELRQLLAKIVLGEREPAGYGPATMLARLAIYLARNRSRLDTAS